MQLGKAQGNARQLTHSSQAGHPFSVVGCAYVPDGHSTAGQKTGVHLTHLGQPGHPFGCGGRMICVPGGHVG